MADPINPSPRLYGELAAWWPLLSDPGDYVEEATFYQTQLLAACDGEARTLLELGSGGAATPAASAVLDKAGEVALDSAVTVRIKSALLADPAIKSLKIDVETKDGVVALSGTVPSAANAERAVTVAKGVDGVKSVVNRLTVKAST